jgi:hypothetical protein
LPGSGLRGGGSHRRSRRQIVAEYFGVRVSRSVPWSRRPEAARLLADCARQDRDFEAVVIGALDVRNLKRTRP